MPSLSLLIKPASSNCDLRCKYCFYHLLADSRTTPSYGIMSIDTLENVVKAAFAYADTACAFAFQGGEPTLAGLGYYKKLLEFVHRYNSKNIPVSFALQTNGMHIEEEWCDFLAKNKFLVGLSLDGPKDIHDLHRVDIGCQGTFKKVMRTVELFQRYQVDFNILNVVTARSARHVNAVYRFFTQNNLHYLQFIPCLDPLDQKRGQFPHSLKPEHYEVFLKDTFDLWYKDFIRGNYISIRYFDNLIRMMLGQRPEICSMNGVCQCQCVIEADGGVYPCDFYVIDKWQLGNINEMAFKDIMNSDINNKFVSASITVSVECKECKWFPLCRGGCRREREDYIEGISLNYYCQAYKGFFEYSYPRLLHIARIVANQR